MILSYWPFTSNELSDAEAFFMATRLLQFWWFLTTHSGTDSWITLLLFFNVFLLGLASCFHFSDPIIDLFSVCFAVELLYQWWWSMLTILSRYVQLFFFNYMCWKQCCSKVQHLVLRLIELLYQYSTIFSANGNTFTHFVTSGCVYWDTTLLCLIGNQ